MRYMLLIYGSPTAEAPPSKPDDAFEDWVAATEALRAGGTLVAGDGLQGVEVATTTRFRDGRLLLTDGPFAESKEHLLGYYVIEAEDLDAALGWAGRMPNVHWGAVEVRPVMAGPASA